MPASTRREGESAIDWNARLDNYLAATGTVDLELYNGFVHAHGYDAASSVGWLIAKLKILKSRLENGHSLDICEGDAMFPSRFDNIIEFENWVESKFPNAVNGMNTT